MNKVSKISLSLLIAAAGALTSCNDSQESVPVRLFDTTSSEVGALLVDGSEDVMTRTVQCGLSQPVEKDVKVTYVVSDKLAEMYNAMYNAKALPLPVENYEIANPVAEIPAGGVLSNAIDVTFKGLTDIDRDNVYVLGLEITGANVPVLGSAAYKFFVVRPAALVNWAADITENFLYYADGSAPLMAGLAQMTVESVVYEKEWGGMDSNIQSWMGIEGNSLLRFSDAGLPADQLQWAHSTNTTSSLWTAPAGKWIHIAFTFDSTTGACQFFVDGQKRGDTMNNTRSAVNWNSTGFYIGKSWNDNRWFNGMICEARVWARCLSADEIAAKNHAYTVDPASEGLVAYWKFNEGGGNLITDVTNGYNLQANNNIVWVPISLPE